MPNNILITPGQASIEFSGSAANNLKLQVLSNGNVAITGSVGKVAEFSNTGQVFVTRSMQATQFTGSFGIIAFVGTASRVDDGAYLSLAQTFTAQKTFSAGIELSNSDITGVGNITINDPGPGEGIAWAGGNLWKIYESPNDLTTNAGGNLQIVENATRRATFNTSGQFEIPVATGTAPFVVASTTVVTNLNADLLDGYNTATANTANTVVVRDGSGNFSAGTITAYLAGYADAVDSNDTRSTNDTPTSRNSGVYFDFKANSTNALSDGGTYNGQMTWRSYGSGTDLSGGQVMQIAYTENSRIWTRLGNSNTTWASWRQLLNSVDQLFAYNMNQNVRTTDAVTFAGVTSTGTVNINTGNVIQLYTSAGNLRGHIQATDTDDAHLIIATSGGEDITFRDGGTAGSTNMVIRGNGDVQAYNSVIAPIFYDTTTSYYGDFASTSRMNVVRGDQILTTYHSMTSTYYGGGATPSTGYLITTNIDYGVFNMPIVIIEGYAYGSSVPIKLTIVWYSYSPDPSGWTNLSYINSGGWDPGTITIGRNGSGKVCIHLSNNIYYGRFNVRAIYDQGHSYLEGWSVSEAGTGGLSQPRTIPRVSMVTDITGNASSETLQTVTVRGQTSNQSLVVTGLRLTGTFNTSTNDVYANMRVIQNAGGGTADGMYIGYGNASSGITRLYGGGSTGGALEKYSTYTYEPGSFRAPIYYDSDNTTYYLNVSDGGFNLRGGTSNRVTYVTNDSGIIVNNPEGNGVSDVRLGAAWGQAGLYAPTYLSLGTSGTYIEFRFSNTQRGYIDSSGDMFAHRFIDYNNNAYYIDGNSRSILNTLQLGTAASDTTNLMLDVQGNMAIRGASGLYFGVSTNNFNSWTTRLYASGATQYFNAQQFIFDNQGYGSSEFVRINSTAVGIFTSDFSYTANDNSRTVGSTTNNKLFVNGSIQLLSNNDAIVIGRGTATFLSDEELGFGWGGGWYMVDGTYLRVRGSKVLYNDNYIRSDNSFRMQSERSIWGNYGSWSTYISRIAYFSFDWNASYDSYANHGIASTDSAGNFTDSMSINSFNDITLRLDSNNNNGSSYLRLMNDSTTSNQFGYWGYNGSAYEFYTAGTATADTAMYSRQFIDRDNNAFYVDPNGTSVLNSLTINGNLNAFAGQITVNRINFRNTAGSSASDPYALRFVTDNSNTAWVEFQLNDDANEELRIYGYSCAGYGCGEISGNLYHRFRSDGWAWHSSDVEAARFVDNGNTGYYLDPAGFSRLDRIDPNEIYNYGWFRNHTSGRGLYQQAHDTHWYSNSPYWKAGAGGNSYGGIVLYQSYESSLRGYLYWDGSGFGLLNSSGNWQLRIEYGNANMELYRITYGNEFQAYIYRDRDSTGYYIDPTSTTAIRTVGSWRADSAGWDGEFSGKIQYHSSHWYFQSGNLWLFRNAGGGNVVSIDQNGYITAGTYYTSNWFRPTGCSGLYFESYGHGLWAPECEGNSYGNVATYGSGRNGWRGYGLGSRWTLMNSGNGDNIGVHDNSRGNWLWYWDGGYTRWNFGYNYFAGDVRSWRFYDHDTAYFFDGNDNSNWVGLTTRGKAMIGETAKTNWKRPDITGDTNYWVGSMGWGAYDMYSIMDWGSGFFDTWSGANYPPGHGHWTGVQAFHYSAGYNYAYGWQLVGGPATGAWFKSSWPNSRSWYKIAMYGLSEYSNDFYSTIMYDANNGGYYNDPDGTSRMNFMVPNRMKLVNNVNYDPRWDFTAYVVEAQHWYGNFNGMTMWMGESANVINVPGTLRPRYMEDYNNTGYYIDMDGTTNIVTLYNEGQYGRWWEPKGVGGDSGNGGHAYRIFQEGGGWGYPYPDLRIAFHTGIKMGANGPSYEGLRIYSDYDMSGILIQLNGGSNYSFWYTWQNLTGYHGIYSGINNAHIYPNPDSYGSWRMIGSRNGWGGIQFDNSICLMMNYSEHGFYSTALGWRLYLNGSVYTPGDVVAYWSDERLKENIRPLKQGEGLDTISRLVPSRFRWKESAKLVSEMIPAGTEEISIIAQDAQQVIPNAIVTNKSGKKVSIDGSELTEYLTVNYDKISPYLIAAIKDLKAEIEQLKEQLKKAG